MRMNPEGHVRKITLPATPANVLWPLHEAVVKSIDAIEDGIEMLNLSKELLDNHRRQFTATLSSSISSNTWPTSSTTAAKQPRPNPKVVR